MSTRPSSGKSSATGFTRRSAKRATLTRTSFISGRCSTMTRCLPTSPGIRVIRRSSTRASSASRSIRSYGTHGSESTQTSRTKIGRRTQSRFSRQTGKKCSKGLKFCGKRNSPTTTSWLSAYQRARRPSIRRYRTTRSTRRIALLTRSGLTSTMTTEKFRLTSVRAGSFLLAQTIPLLARPARAIRARSSGSHWIPKAAICTLSSPPWSGASRTLSSRTQSKRAGGSSGSIKSPSRSSASRRYSFRHISRTSWFNAPLRPGSISR